MCVYQAANCGRLGGGLGASRPPRSGNLLATIRGQPAAILIIRDSPKLWGELLMPKLLSFSNRHRRWSLLIALVVFLALGCRGSIGVDELTTPLPTLTPTATPRPHRMDCVAIESSKGYLHGSEQSWFIANCLTGPVIQVTHNELPGIGTRVMEIYTVDEAICGSGFLSFMVLHEHNMEDFSYLFRNFCAAYFTASTLRFPPPPFGCPAGEIIEAVDVALEYLTGFARHATEVLCSPAEELGDDAS